MAFKQHDRIYDIVVFGATGAFYRPPSCWLPGDETGVLRTEIGMNRHRSATNICPMIGYYTGKYTSEYIAATLPTTLKWAVAGRSRSKLRHLLRSANLSTKIAANLVSALSDKAHYRSIPLLTFSTANSDFDLPAKDIEICSLTLMN